MYPLLSNEALMISVLQNLQYSSIFFNLLLENDSFVKATTSSNLLSYLSYTLLKLVSKPILIFCHFKPFPKRGVQNICVTVVILIPCRTTTLLYHFFPHLTYIPIFSSLYKFFHSCIC